MARTYVRHLAALSAMLIAPLGATSGCSSDDSSGSGGSAGSAGSGGSAGKGGSAGSGAGAGGTSSGGSGATGGGGSGATGGSGSGATGGGGSGGGAAGEAAGGAAGDNGNPDGGTATTCTESDGTVATALCCLSASDFPNTCDVGACGCAPGNSHQVQVCNCPQGQCFDGSQCQ